ncbi:MAG: hypothetical protein J6R45_06415 [Clostridia bacterium]|nr:hypothetical protein [Clostridia bacterium]
MKKNRMMRLASGLLVAVLLTTCAISGTFAKYVTEGQASDSARVAKWGVTIKAENFDLFTTDYKTDDTTATFTGDYSVSSEGTANRDDVMAPGTSGKIANIAITGTPEVAVEVAVKATVSVSGNWLVDGDFYCPIVITVGTDKISGLDYDSAANFAAAINDKLEDKTAQYAPNKDLSTIGDDTNLDLEWAWAFEDATGTKNNQTDKKDTVLGDRAVAEDLKIDIKVEISVTQID